jgi:hypothetical protein
MSNGTGAPAAAEARPPWTDLSSKNWFGPITVSPVVGPCTTIGAPDWSAIHDALLKAVTLIGLNSPLADSLAMNE